VWSSKAGLATGDFTLKANTSGYKHRIDPVKKIYSMESVSGEDKKVFKLGFDFDKKTMWEIK
jgi:hypothetical protein